MNGNLALRIPRDLLDPLLVNLPIIDREGLVSVYIEWDQGRIIKLNMLQDACKTSLPLGLSPFIEPHAHIDKAYSCQVELGKPYNIAQSILSNCIEHNFRTPDNIQKRVNYSLVSAWTHGLRGIRTHIDSLGPANKIGWEIIQDLRSRWINRIVLQLVALQPLPYWSTIEGLGLAQKIAKCGGLLGGILGPPYSNSTYRKDEVVKFFQLAEDLGCSVDLHVDEANELPGYGVHLITRIMEKHQFNISITCSHASSMGLLPTRELCNLAERMASVNLQVIALPFTNFWLLGRINQTTPIIRPIAPIHELQSAGVNVVVGSDNVQDSWFPRGNFDIIDLIRFSNLVTHLSPWNRQGLSLFFTAPSRLMGLEWDGIFRVGAPADLIILDCEKWQSLLIHPPKRQILRNGEWLFI